MSGIDYLVLVNKRNPLPAGWAEALETVTVTNSLGEEIPLEKKACAAFRALAEAMEGEGIRLELDSALRSVEDQRAVAAHFLEKNGPDYVRRYVAVPGYSEHHTGLALDLYFITGGRTVYTNEEMNRPENAGAWAAIHAKLAAFGFILRYPPDGEAETGYAYEPWHVRYLDDPDAAREIMDRGIVLETWLAEKRGPAGRKREPDVE